MQKITYFYCNYLTIYTFLCIIYFRKKGSKYYEKTEKRNYTNHKRYDH